MQIASIGDIWMKYQILFSEKKIRIKDSQFVICWISQKSGKIYVGSDIAV